MKKYRNISLIFILLALITTTIIFHKGREKSEYKIGTILPLTGSAAYLGESIQRGMLVAQEEATTKGGVNGYMIGLLFEDSMNDAKAGVSAYKRLLTNKDISVICSAMSTVSRAIIPLSDKDKMPLLCTAVSADGITKESPWVFRFFTRADIDAAILAEFAIVQLKLKRVAVIHVQDDFGISYKNEFIKKFEDLGGTVPAVESFAYSATDFRTQLTKIKGVRPDGIYILSYANNMALIPREIRELGIPATLLSVGTISQDAIIKQAPDAIEGCYYTTNAFDTNNPQTEEMKLFVSAFEKKYAKKPEYFEVFGYDMVNIIIKAIETNGYSRTGIRSGLLNIKNYKGAVGDIFISNDREVSFPVVIARVLNGHPSKPLFRTDPSNQNNVKLVDANNE